jgi:hypothetical protein
MAKRKLRTRCGVEARASTLPEISVEGELRHKENRSRYVNDRLIHAPGAIFENAKTGDLADDVGAVIVTVVCRHSQKNKKPPPYFPNHRSVHTHRRVIYSLHQSPHLSSPGEDGEKR